MAAMAKINPAEFVRQVRQEMARVTWPSRKETLITAAMVIIMAMLAALFFFAVDAVISVAMRLLFGIGA